MLTARQEAEHELDRFTQVKDVYAMSTEEHPKSEQLNMWNRLQEFAGPDARESESQDYGQILCGGGVGRARALRSSCPIPPAGIPLWAFRQADLLGRVKKFADWYVDNRQSEFGDFGGGFRMIRICSMSGRGSH